MRTTWRNARLTIKTKEGGRLHLTVRKCWQCNTMLLLVAELNWTVFHFAKGFPLYFVKLALWRLTNKNHSGKILCIYTTLVVYSFIQHNFRLWEGDLAIMTLKYQHEHVVCTVCVEKSDFVNEWMATCVCLCVIPIIYGPTLLLYEFWSLHILKEITCINVAYWVDISENVTCMNYTPEQSKCLTGNKIISILHLNIRSMNKCRDELASLGCCFNIIGCSETWLHDKSYINILNLEGYVLHYKNRPDKLL